MTIPFHPLANLFPLIEGKEFDELVADIKANGLQTPITLYEGKILEGRNRARACEAAGIEPSTRLYQGSDPTGYIFSANILRRHLTPSQRAMFLAEFATMKRGHAQSQRDDSQLCESPLLTATEAAKLAEVGKRTMDDAKIVHTNGTPAQIEKVKQGDISVSTMAHKVRARGNGQGSHVKVPAGYKCLSEAVKPGIDLERKGASSREVAKKIGISLQTYVCVRDAVLLSKRKDLSERDLKMVQTALHEIDETRRVKHAQELMKPLSLKVWGRNGNRYKTDKSRVTAFTESIMFVVTGCTAIGDREIPALEKKPRADTIKELNAAISALTKLRRRLKREEHS
jgi:hypothetical protein